MIDQKKRQEYIEIYRQGAENWRNKGNLIRETKSLSSLWMNYLAVTVLECNNSQAAKEWWSKHNAYPILERYAEAMCLLVVKVDSGEVPISTIAGNYPHLVFTHLAWALEEFNLGMTLANIASRPDVLELSTPFWQEYAHAINALIAGRPYSSIDMEVEGQEAYWEHYLHIIESATNQQDISIVIADANKAFIHRNSDTTIKDDAHEIEGSGEHPVLWDFRRDGLLSYIHA